ncbi:hypothetical protein D3C85_1604530 [compost metagenome]
MPLRLSTRLPLPPGTMARLLAVRLGPSTSLALASSSAWVMTRAPLSSAMAARVTGPLTTGASLTGVIVRL